MIEERFHRDDDGRPLREGRTPDEYQRPGEIEYRACPYPGSRQGGQMNVSALRQTSAHWDELVGALGLLRTAYAEAIGGFGPDVMELWDVWRISQLGSALPWFFVLRGEPLPAYAAALSKATLGTGILAQRLIQQMLVERWAPPPFTTDALRALAESTGTLVSDTEVCAAPDKMIARFLDVLIAGAPGTGIATIDALAARRPDVLAFGACYAGFKLAVWLYYQARRFLYADVLVARPDAAPAMHALLRAPCEPPDFFIIEPANLAAVPPVLRAAWLGQLAALIAPFAPDGRDAAIRSCADQMALAMAADAAIADPVARARHTFARLDALHGALIAQVEAGFRGAPYDGPIDADVRDRLMAASPRAAFAALGPA